MDPQIQHDPRTKQQIKDALYMHLYAPVQKDFKARLDALIIRNCRLLKLSHKSFSYKGEMYSCDMPPFPRKANRLAPDLVIPMDEYLKDLKQLNDQEIPYVIGFINQVLNASNDLCDYLELFPSALHRPIQQFIQACPCRTKHLTKDEVQGLQDKNEASIELIKSRMVTNLLI